jgi:hypothetical protein
MRFSFVVAVSLFLAGCFPAAPLRQTPEAQGVAKPGLATAKPRVEPTSTLPAQAPRLATADLSEITFEGVAFDSQSHRLVVLDQAAGPGSEFANSTAAAEFLEGFAAINAGFFTPEGSPLGLVVSNGKSAGAWNSASSLGSASWHEDASGKSAISRRDALGRTAASAMRELLQAGPLLVENGGGISGLDATKASARSLILWDGGMRWWIGRSSPCTLAAASQALSTGSPAGWKIRHVLNLDGGRSSDLWISSRIPGGPVLRRPPWNRPVRNFLVLVSR